MIIQKIIMVIALYYIATGIMDYDYVTLIGAVIIYIFELFIMHRNNRNNTKDDHEIKK